MRRRLSVCTAFLACGLFISLGTTAFADWNFREDFNGSFGNTWTSNSTDLPSTMYDYMWSTHYNGAPSGTFETVDGASCYRMTNTQADQKYVAWESQTVLQGGVGHIEARINTLTQDGHHPDGMFQISLVSTDNKWNYVSVGLWNDDFDAYRFMECGMYTLNSGYGMTGGTSPVYSNNTWCRVTLDALPDQIVFSIWDDTNTQLLARRSTLDIQSQTFPKQLSSLGSNFRIVISQDMGIPQQAYNSGYHNDNPPPYTNDVAVDWITAGASPVPEPSTLLPLLTGLAALGGLALKRNKPSR